MLLLLDVVITTSWSGNALYCKKTLSNGDWRYLFQTSIGHFFFPHIIWLVRSLHPSCFCLLSAQDAVDSQLKMPDSSGGQPLFGKVKKSSDLVGLGFPKDCTTFWKQEDGPTIVRSRRTLHCRPSQGKHNIRAPHNTERSTHNIITKNGQKSII